MKGKKLKEVSCLILGLAMLMVLLCGCGESDVSTKTDETPISDNSLVTSANIKEITINDTTLVDGFECRIKEINWYSASDFDYDVVQAVSGFEYIVIVFSEKNTNSDTENAPMFSLLSADGVECTQLTALSLYKKQYKVNFGATMPDTTAEAYAIYQIPKGAESFKLQILSNGFGENSQFFVFTREDIK